jgi:hypothetical protein
VSAPWPFGESEVLLVVQEEPLSVIALELKAAFALFAPNFGNATGIA